MLDGVPGALGANNHMGSKMTADAMSMDAVMRVLNLRGLYFLDSRTGTGSVALAAAARAGVPAMGRDVFLDDGADKATVAARLAELAAIARARGCAVGIGHPHPATAAAIMRFALDPSRDVDLVRLPGLLALPCRAGAP